MTEHAGHYLRSWLRSAQVEAEHLPPLGRVVLRLGLLPVTEEQQQTVLVVERQLPGGMGGLWLVLGPQHPAPWTGPPGYRSGRY